MKRWDKIPERLCSSPSTASARRMPNDLYAFVSTSALLGLDDPFIST
jgi:hypothetical protein